MRPRSEVGVAAALMLRVAEGDQEAFAQLYDQTSRTVFGIVLRVLRDQAQAEEVTQEVYVQAWRQARNYDSTLGSPATWLNTLAHRRAIDRVRSSQRARRRDQREFDLQVGLEHQADPAEVTVARDEGRRVRSALADLPDAQRTALSLAYFEGLTQRQVAESLQIPLGTAKTRIRDAMTRLRYALEGDLHE
ncbi:MAG: sigma-70 family RNA polymerase sigma factor [Nocardioidaceae bacterium]